MITGLLVLLASALIAWWIAGARSLAYLLYYLSFAPFVTLDHGFHESESESDAFFLGLAWRGEACESLEQALLVVFTDAVTLIAHDAASLLVFDGNQNHEKGK